MAGSLTGTIIAEKYRLGELLRRGEAADLYDARHVLMDKQVSIRVLRPSVAADSENVEKFFDEYGLHTPEPTVIINGEEVSLLQEKQLLRELAAGTQQPAAAD